MTLWEKLTSFGNLYEAAMEAQRGVSRRVLQNEARCPPP